MITIGDKSGGKSISFGNELRLAGAGRIVGSETTELFTGKVVRLIIGAQTVISVAGDTVTLTDGQAVLISPETFYSLTACEKGAVYADIAAAERLFDSAYKCVAGESCARIETLVDAVATQDGALLLASEVFSLLSEYLAVARSPHTVDEIKNFINTYFYLPITVDKLSKAAGYSRGYLTAKFTSEVGISPYRYVTETRLKVAAKLLRESDASVSTVAAVCGYAGIERFCDMFRRFTGKSPLRYRAEHSAVICGEKNGRR